MKKGLFRKGLVFGIILLFLGIYIIPTIAQDIEKPSPALRGNWLYVGGNGPGNYTRIQDAIDNASTGDTVFVYDDSSPYSENVIVNKSITLIGEDRNTTVIDGSGGDRTIHILADRVSISEFTIQNGGIYIFYLYNNIISNNIISNNKYGIKLYHSSGNTIKGNIISNNQFGIYLVGGTNSIMGNNITDNKNGIYLSGTLNFILKNNFIDNEKDTSFVSYFDMSSDSLIDLLLKRNRWMLNYWDRARVLPKFILGTIYVKVSALPGWLEPFYPFPWFNFDWRPALKPYDIEV